MPFDFFSHLFMSLIEEDRCFSIENSCKQNDVYFKLGKNRIQTQICNSWWIDLYVLRLYGHFIVNLIFSKCTCTYIPDNDIFGEC